MNNKSKVKKNLIFTVIAEIITIILGVVLPRLVLVNYGSEVNGVINSIAQIYSYLSLLEAGIISVLFKALFKTTANDEKQETNSV